MKIIGKGCIGNNWLNCLQERSLLVYNDQISTFEELLQRDRKINRNIQGLAIELYKVDLLSANFRKWSNTLKQFVGKFADELFECL